MAIIGDYGKSHFHNWERLHLNQVIQWYLSLSLVLYFTQLCSTYTTRNVVKEGNLLDSRKASFSVPLYICRVIRMYTNITGKLSLYILLCSSAFNSDIN